MPDEHDPVNPSPVPPVTPSAPAGDPVTGTPPGEHRLDSGKSHAKRAADDLRAAADDLKAAASAKAQELRSNAHLKADEYRGRAEGAYRDARVRAEHFRSDGEQYIRDNPFQALLYAFGAGFLIGLILRK